MIIKRKRSDFMQNKTKIISFDYEELDMSAQRYCVRGIYANGIYIIRFYCDEYINEVLKKIGSNNCKLSSSQSIQLSHVLNKLISVPKKYDSRNPHILDGFVGSLVLNFDDGTKRYIFNERASELYEYLESNANSYIFTNENIDFLNKIVIGKAENTIWDYDAFLGGTT